jgi:predicted nucleic acid-binding protein
MPKPKLYLDTSVISHLDQPEKISEYQATHEFWNKVKLGIFDIYISDTVENEIKRCKPDKAEILFGYLGQINYHNIEINDKIVKLSSIIIEAGIVPRKSFEDSMHIACAVLTECDYLLSWNMKHLTNTVTNEKMRILTIGANLNTISIIPPSMVQPWG